MAKSWLGCVHGERTAPRLPLLTFWTEAGVEVPTTYEEMLAAAEKIRSMGLMENPVGGAYAAGWNLATQEFNNMYLGHGGELFAAGSQQSRRSNNEQGVAALSQ